MATIALKVLLKNPPLSYVCDLPKVALFHILKAIVNSYSMYNVILYLLERPVFCMWPRHWLATSPTIVGPKAHTEIPRVTC